MTSRTLGSSLWCALVAVVAATTASEQPTPRAPQEEYRILVERNIFDRDRGRASQQVAAASQAAPRSGRSVFLTGIAVDRGTGLAFFEDVWGGTSKVRAGQMVADIALVKRITLDFVEVERDGETSTVRIGESLDGGPPDFAPGGAGDGSAEPAPATAAAPPLDTASQADILERMRQRRKTELDGG